MERHTCAVSDDNNHAEVSYEQIEVAVITTRPPQQSYSHAINSGETMNPALDAAAVEPALM
jgi:hypothetical protein